MLFNPPILGDEPEKLAADTVQDYLPGSVTFLCIVIFDALVETVVELLPDCGGIPVGLMVIQDLENVLGG